MKARTKTQPFMVDRIENGKNVRRRFGQVSVVFERKKDAAFPGVVATVLQALRNRCEVAFVFRSRASVPRKHTHARCAKLDGMIDPPFHKLDLLCAVIALRHAEVVSH